MRLKKCIKRKVFKYLLPRLMSKKCPRCIPLSGEAGDKVDCYFVHFSNGVSGHIDSIDLEKFELQVLTADDKGEYRISKKISVDDILGSTIDVRHYYRKHIITCDSLARFLIHYVTRYQQFMVNFLIVKEKIFQKKFNRKSLLSHQYVELLKIILDNQLDNSKNESYKGINCNALMTKIHSERWIDHPDGQRNKAKIQIFLDSFIDDGTCNKEKQFYRITGKAIQYIQEYETEESRHIDSLAVQRGIRCLTWIIALSAILQAGVIEWPEEWIFRPILKNVVGYLR